MRKLLWCRGSIQVPYHYFCSLRFIMQYDVSYCRYPLFPLCMKGIVVLCKYLFSPCRLPRRVIPIRFLFFSFLPVGQPQTICSFLSKYAWTLWPFLIQWKNELSEYVLLEFNWIGWPDCCMNNSCIRQPWACGSPGNSKSWFAMMLVNILSNNNFK